VKNPILLVDTLNTKKSLLMLWW